MFGAIFMATDYATSPVTLNGQLLYGCGIGVLTVLIRHLGGFPEGMRLGEDQWLWIRMMQEGCTFCFSPMSLVRYSKQASNRSAAIYRAEKSEHTIAELYIADQMPTLNEYIARVGIGKAITQCVRGGTEDAQKAIEAFGYTRSSRSQLRRLRILNSMPAGLRPVVDSIYSSLAWLLMRRGL